MIRLAAALALSACTAAADTSPPLGTIASEAFRLYEIEVPHPRVILAPDDYDLLAGAEGRAILYEDGSRKLFISETAAQGSAHRLRGLVYHETAHFAAWERHGPRIQPHGLAFTRICRQHASAADCRALVN